MTPTSHIEKMTGSWLTPDHVSAAGISCAHLSDLFELVPRVTPTSRDLSHSFQLLASHPDTPMSQLFGSIHLLRLFGESRPTSVVSVRNPRLCPCRICFQEKQARQKCN